MSDRYRPANYQIDTLYECQLCGNRAQQVSVYGIAPCHCGGQFVEVGESYPADSAEWDEEFVDGEWRQRS